MADGNEITEMAPIRTPPPSINALMIWGFLMRALRHRTLMVSIAMGISAVTAIKLVLMPNKYQYTSKIVLQGGSSPLTGSLGTLASLAGVGGGASGNDPSLYFPDIALSSGILQNILKQRWKAIEAVEDTSQSFLLQDFWGIDPDTTLPRWKDALAENLQRRLVANGYLNVEADKKTGVISVSTTFEDPLLAYNVNQFVVEQANDVLVHKMNSSAAENRRFIEGRLQKVQSDLANAEERYIGFLENNRGRGAPTQQVEEARLQRSLQVSQEVYLQLVKQYEAAKIEEVKNLPLIEKIDQPNIPVKKASPKRTLILMVVSVFGGLVGLISAATWDLYVEDRKGFLQRIANFIRGVFSDNPE
jgi:capsule polysaccharide export protein KpsE/RkpR